MILRMLGADALKQVMDAERLYRSDTSWLLHGPREDAPIERWAPDPEEEEYRWAAE